MRTCNKLKRLSTCSRAITRCLESTHLILIIDSNIASTTNSMRRGCLQGISSSSRMYSRIIFQKLLPWLRQVPNHRIPRHSMSQSIWIFGWSLMRRTQIPQNSTQPRLIPQRSSWSAAAKSREISRVLVLLTKPVLGCLKYLGNLKMCAKSHPSNSKIL